LTTTGGRRHFEILVVNSDNEILMVRTGNVEITARIIFMSNKQGLLDYSHTDKIVFALSLFVSLFWYLGQHINVYRLGAVGAIFELASLPMLALFIALPIVCILLLVKKGISFTSLPLYSLLLLLGAFLLIAL